MFSETDILRAVVLVAFFSAFFFLIAAADIIELHVECFFLVAYGLFVLILLIWFWFSKHLDECIDLLFGLENKE